MNQINSSRQIDQNEFKNQEINTNSPTQAIFNEVLAKENDLNPAYSEAINGVLPPFDYLSDIELNRIYNLDKLRIKLIFSVRSLSCLSAHSNISFFTLYHLHINFFNPKKPNDPSINKISTLFTQLLEIHDIPNDLKTRITSLFSEFKLLDSEFENTLSGDGKLFNEKWNTLDKAKKLILSDKANKIIDQIAYLGHKIGDNITHKTAEEIFHCVAKSNVEKFLELIRNPFYSQWTLNHFDILYMRELSSNALPLKPHKIFSKVCRWYIYAGFPKNEFHKNHIHALEPFTRRTLSKHIVDITNPIRKPYEENWSKELKIQLYQALDQTNLPSEQELHEIIFEYANNKKSVNFLTQCLADENTERLRKQEENKLIRELIQHYPDTLI